MVKQWSLCSKSWILDDNAGMDTNRQLVQPDTYFDRILEPYMQIVAVNMEVSIISRFNLGNTHCNKR